MTEIKLKVGELTQRDEYGKGIARVDSKDMVKLGIKEGEIIDLNGRTGVVVVRAYPSDIGHSIIRIDGLVRKNAQASVGEMVVVKKAEPKDAKKVILAPAEKNISIHVAPNLIKQNIYMRPLNKGDILIPNMVFRRDEDDNDDGSVDPFAELPPIFKAMLGGMGGAPMGRSEVFFGGQLKLAVVKTVPDGIVQITDDTEIEISSVAVTIEDKKMPTVTYEDIGGLKEVVPKIREMIEVPLRHPEIFERLGVEPPRGVLLYGPPGSGKTLLAKAVANESGANFISVAGPEIMSKFYGGSEENLRKIFEDAEKNAPSIIFIDEIDSIAPKREEVTGEVERRVVSQLLTLMDGLKSRGKVIVIAATNRPNSIDQALRRGGRFDREIEIGVPDKLARKEILQIHTRNMPLEKDVNVIDLSEITHGYVGADLAALAKEAAMSALRRVLPEISVLKENEAIPKEVVKKLRVTKEDFEYALHMVQPSAMREVMIEIPKIKWEDVGGLIEVKESLKEAIEWPLKHPDSFERLGIKPPRGILMYGPPGCGKTMIAKAVANQANANFISIKGPEVFSKWVGESEKQIRNVFRRARQVAPSIIFIDEIDAVTPKRGTSDGSHVTEQVVSQLLTEMSGLEDLKGVVVLAASVTDDTPIMIKDNKGIQIVPISKFVDKYYGEGEEGREKPVFGVKCLGFDKTQNNPKYTSGLRFGESSFKSIRGVFRHKINEIYEIEFIGGKIRTTGNHSVFVRTNHGIEAKPVSSLKSGEILVDLPYRPRTDKQRDNRAHNFDKDFHLELPVFETNMQLENAYSLAMESPFSQNQIGLQLGFSQAAISNWQRNVCVPRGLSKKYFKHNLPEKINITPDLMRLFGYYVAEGYARKEIDFCFGSEEKHLINDVKLLMKNFFGLNPDKVYNKIDDNATHIIYYSRPLADFFIRYCGKGANFKHVPPFLFEAPKKIFLEFLRGYSEGDGHLTKDGKLEITSVSKQLITELNWLCRMHGIKPSISQFTTMEGRTINGGKPLKATKAYRLGFGKTGNPFNNSEVSISQRAIIKSIKKIPFDGYVYDLCGCDNEAFFGGETPILLHNTNRPDIIDPALLRPGRFDRMIYVPAPDEKTRLEILKVHTKNMPLKGVDLKKIADKTDGYSGADLEALVREAGLISLREDIKSKEVNSKHFEAASKKIKPSITDDMFKKYHKAVEDVKKNKIEDESKASRYIG